jgi:hypothetical protein
VITEVIMRCYALFQVALFAGFATAEAQAAAPSARVAALQFAVANGFSVDRSNTVVVREADYMRAHGSANRSTEEERSRDALAMARALGPAVSVAAARDVLECQRNYCAAAGTKAVLTVDEPGNAEGGMGVLVQVYSPSQNLALHPRGTSTLMIVLVRQQGNGWVGEKALAGPTQVVVRIPPT